MKSLPMKMFTIYILFTLFISFFGPMKYYNYDKFPVLLYIILFLFSLFLGYTIANKYKIVVRKTPKSSNKMNSTIQGIYHNKILRFISIAILMALLSIAFEFLEICIKNPSSLSLKKMSNNYLNIREVLRSDNIYSLPMMFRFATGFFRNISLILGPYYWKEIRKKDRKMLIIFILLLIIVNMIAYGTQKFLGDIVIYLIIVLSIKMMDADKKKRIKIFNIALFLLVSAVFVFSFVQAQRYKLLGITVQNFETRSNGLQYFDINHIIFRIFGYEFGLGIAILLTGYLSSGYYGLSLCFKLPFEWTYGIGNSYVISKLISLVFQVPNIYEKTYLNKLTEYFGRDGLRSWNTIFPWLASDLTFIGALLIFIIVGYIWQTAWMEILFYRNPISIVLFTTISLGLIFVPANNQLFNGIDTYFSTIFIILYWFLNHRKYNYHDVEKYDSKIQNIMI